MKANKMKANQEKRIRSFAKFLFEQNNDLITITITATSKKSKKKSRRIQLGSKVNGISLRRQDFVLSEDME